MLHTVTYLYNEFSHISTTYARKFYSRKLFSDCTVFIIASANNLKKSFNWIRIMENYSLIITIIFICWKRGVVISIKWSRLVCSSIRIREFNLNFELLFMVIVVSCQTHLYVQNIWRHEWKMLCNKNLFYYLLLF